MLICVMKLVLEGIVSDRTINSEIHMIEGSSGIGWNFGVF